MAAEHVSTIEFRSAIRQQGALELVVVEPQATYVLRLGSEKKVSIGRARDADVRLTDDAVSDYHAALHLGPNGFTVQDLGSLNGTGVGGLAVGPTPIPVAIGEPIRVGSTILIVRKTPPTPRRRKLWSHHFFMARLEEECERATATQGGLALIRIRTSLPRERMAAEVGRHLTLADLWGEFATNDYEILLCPSTPAAANRRLEDLRKALPDCRAAVASLGQDGHRADQLLAVASDRLPRDGGSAPGPVRQIAASPAMKELFAKAAVIAESGASSVLVLGETGTGKEVLARFLHDRSPRRHKPFAALDCGAIAANLAEDLLFGHWKGAFSGADDDQAGLLEAAAGGTVLLDEFQNLPLNIQASLLRVLEQREVLRLGPGRRPPIPVDFRLIAAGSRDPADAVQSKEFRADLHYRVSAFRLTIPPLRDRPEDIVPLAHLFLERFCLREGKVVALSEPATTLLMNHSWPGNVRELRNVIERTVVLCQGPLIDPDDLDIPMIDSDMNENDGSSEENTPLDGLSRADARQAVVDALIRSGCVKADAARRLGLRSKTTLLKKMDELGLPRPKRAKDE